MQKGKNFALYFIVFLILSFLILEASNLGILRPLNSLAAGIFSPFQAITYGVYIKATDLGQSKEVKALKEENLALTQKLIDQNKLTQDNIALRDQFQIQTPPGQNLVPADVIGAPSFIPGVSAPETLVLDRGQADGVKAGDAVIYQDNLIGKVDRTSYFLSSIILITDSSSSFTAKTLTTNASGVVKGQGGGEMILDNVLLSDNLQKGDTVLTKGSVGFNGSGFPPDLIVGKISSVSKNPSDLFQKAEITSLVDFTNLNKVFILTNY